MAKSICHQVTTGAGRGLGVLQSAANLLMAMLAGGKHTLIHGRLEGYINFIVFPVAVPEKIFVSYDS